MKKNTHNCLLQKNCVCFFSPNCEVTLETVEAKLRDRTEDKKDEWWDGQHRGEFITCLRTRLYDLAVIILHFLRN